jgi:ribosomal protein S20
MELDEIKSALKALPTDERRKIALYILELEKEHVQKTYGPQIAEDVESVSKVFQEAVEKLKKFAKKN